MKLRLERDLAFFDLEATGTDPARDRIVQLAVVRATPEGDRSEYVTLVDPEMPIPPEAIAVHHITDEMVRAAPRWRDVALKVLGLLEGADLGGFGVIRYDLPLLASEFKRCGVAFDLAGRRVVDALNIFHRLEPRNLSAACEFYCGKTLEGAHDALADASAALEVLQAQVARYRGRPNRPDLPDTIEGLAAFCAAGDGKNVDSRGKFVWRFGEAAFNFGKHQTRALAEVVRLDRSYVEWLAGSGSATPEVADICRAALEGRFPKKT